MLSSKMGFYHYGEDQDLLFYVMFLFLVSHKNLKKFLTSYDFCVGDQFSCYTDAFLLMNNRYSLIACYWTGYEYCKRKLSQSTGEKNRNINNFAAGALSGSVISCVLLSLKSLVNVVSTQCILYFKTFDKFNQDYLPNLVLKCHCYELKNNQNKVCYY